LFMKCTWLVM